MAAPKEAAMLARWTAQVRHSCREVVAHEIRVGTAVAEAADMFRIEGIRGFPEFCGQDLGIPHPEALLLARWAAHRPHWADPAAVDLSDPLAGEVLEMGTRHAARSLGMPPDAFDEEAAQ